MTTTCHCPEHPCTRLSALTIHNQEGEGRSLCVLCYTKGHGWRWQYTDPEPWPDETFDPEEQLSDDETLRDYQLEADRWHGRAG